MRISSYLAKIRFPAHKACLFGLTHISRSGRLARRARILALFLPLGMIGCAPHPRFVSTYCLSKAQFEQLKAQEPGKIHNQLNGDAAHDVGPLAGSAIRLRAYSDGLLEVLGGCVDPNKP